MARERSGSELIRLEYDPIVVEDAGGEGVDYVVALDAAAAKVVVP